MLDLHLGGWPFLILEHLSFKNKYKSKAVCCLVPDVVNPGELDSKLCLLFRVISFHQKALFYL